MQLRSLGGYLLNCYQMRRALILGLAFSILAVGLMPLSACALLTSKTAECAEATAQSPCDRMHPQSSGEQSFQNSSKSCCIISQAPLPELQFKALAIGPAIVTDITPQLFAVPTAALYNSLLVIASPSPPASLSLLCTFLI
jgi:hypothetical protein